jgi:hypothetical protein
MGKTPEPRDPDGARTPRTTQDKDVRIETWFKFLLATFVPLAAAFILPRGLYRYCLAATGILFVTAVVLMVRQELGERRSHDEDP